MSEDPVKMRRIEAWKNKLTRYDPGVPCKVGHLSQRYVRNNLCVQCQKERIKKNYNQYRARAFGLIPLSLSVQPKHKSIIWDFFTTINCMPYDKKMFFCQINPADEQAIKDYIDALAICRTL